MKDYLVVGISCENDLFVASTTVSLEELDLQAATDAIQTHMGCEVDRVLVIHSDAVVSDHTPRTTSHEGARSMDYPLYEKYPDESATDEELNARPDRMRSAYDEVAREAPWTDIKFAGFATAEEAGEIAKKLFGTDEELARRLSDEEPFDLTGPVRWFIDDFGPLSHAGFPLSEKAYLQRIYGP